MKHILSFILFGGMLFLASCNKSNQNSTNALPDGSNPVVGNASGGGVAPSVVSGTQPLRSADPLENVSPGLHGETVGFTDFISSDCASEEGFRKFKCLYDQAKEVMRTIVHQKISSVYECKSIGMMSTRVTTITVVEYDYKLQSIPPGVLACEVRIKDNGINMNYDHPIAASYTSKAFCAKANYSVGKNDSAEEIIQYYESEDQKQDCQLVDSKTESGDYSVTNRVNN